MYDVRKPETLLYDIKVEEKLSFCQTDISLTVLCNGEECKSDSNFFQLTSVQDNLWQVRVYTEDPKFVG